jgi:hypothetical protein
MNKQDFLVFALLLLFPCVENFDSGWPTSFSSFEDSTHYSITECTLFELAGEYLQKVYRNNNFQSIISDQGLPCPTISMYNKIKKELDALKIDAHGWISAVKAIAQANTRQDNVEIFNSATHVDNEEFDNAAQLISKRFDGTLSSILQFEYADARESFGSLLHTVQDFYSHSNWIELGHRVPNRGIGKYQILGRYASKDMPTCDSCNQHDCRHNILPSIINGNILTSGYYTLPMASNISSSVFTPVGKCHHGDSMDLITNYNKFNGGINKDTRDSDHGYLHTVAAAVAYNATKQIFNELWTLIGDETFGRFLSLSPDLRGRMSGSFVFVIDTTGSMGPYIELAKHIAIDIVSTSENLEYRPWNYILSPFNDPKYGPVTMHTTAEGFSDQIKKLIAKGGGDGPELYYHAIIDALKVCEVGSHMYIFTDAPAKDSYLKSLSVHLVRQKQVTITLFYGNGDYQEPLVDTVNPTHNDRIELLDITNNYGLTWLSGSVTMGIDSETLDATKDFISERLQSSQLQRIFIAGNSSNDIFFDVDSSMKSLRVELTAMRPFESVNIKLVTSSGVGMILAPDHAMPFIYTYHIPDLSNNTGEWSVVSTANVKHTIELNTISEIHCTLTLQEKSSRSSSDINNLTPLINSPVKYQPDLFVLTICENLPAPIETGYVNLMDSNDGSNVLQVLQPISISKTGFLSKIVIPNSPFRMSGVIRLTSGEIIQRQQKQLITPASISLVVHNQPYFVAGDNTLTISYTMINHDKKQQTISIDIYDKLGLLTNNTKLTEHTVSASYYKRITESIKMNDYHGVLSNSTIILNSLVFSASTLETNYDEVVPVYIVRNSITLSDQIDYQIPTIVNDSSRQSACLILIVLTLVSNKHVLHI